MIGGTRTKVALSFIAVWLLLIALILIHGLPWLPRSSLQWALLVVAGPPLYIAIEGVGSWLFSHERGQRISGRPFSILRISFALLVTVVLLVLIWYISNALRLGT